MDMKRFKHQVAVVTGGARGIGRAIARRLASEGAAVVIFDVLHARLQKTLEEMGQENLAVSGRSVDIADEEAVRAAIDEVAQRHGRLDILVNCAGIVGESSVKIADYSTSVFDKVIEVNLKGAFLLTKYAVPHMLERNYGRILHIASIGGKEGNPGMVGYAASKSGLMGLVKGVGKEYAQQGITVNGIAPAVIATEMNADTDPAMLKYMTDKIPMGRLGTVDEVAALAAWIVSEEASFNTAYVFDLSGGRATF